MHSTQPLSNEAVRSGQTHSGSFTRVEIRGTPYLVCGRLDRSFLSFWIENANAGLWQHINEPAAGWSGLDQGREILVMNSDPLVFEVSFASGWFQRSARSLQGGSNHEIWRLTNKCLQALGLITEDEWPASQQLSTYLNSWSKQNVRLHVAGAFVTGPALEPQSRRLIGVWPDTLRPAAAQFLLDSGPTPPGAGAYALSSRDMHGWRRLAAALGFQSCAHVCMPAVAGRVFDIALLSMREIGETAHIGEVTLAVFNHWQQMRAALASDGPLSRRESECLEHTANGLNAQECAMLMGCSESNVRQHLARAMRKLAAPSTVAAIRRAQLYGLLL